MPGHGVCTPGVQSTVSPAHVSPSGSMSCHQDSLDASVDGLALAAPYSGWHLRHGPAHACYLRPELGTAAPHMNKLHLIPHFICALGISDAGLGTRERLHSADMRSRLMRGTHLVRCLSQPLQCSDPQPHASPHASRDAIWVLAPQRASLRKSEPSCISAHPERGHVTAIDIACSRGPQLALSACKHPILVP